MSSLENFVNRGVHCIIKIMSTNIQGRFYYHFKHNPKVSVNNYAYEVIGLAKHTETGEITVVYRPLYENEWLQGEASLFSRPLAMFIDTVNKPEYTGPRFRLIEDPDIKLKLNDIRDQMYK